MLVQKPLFRRLASINLGEWSRQSTNVISQLNKHCDSVCNGCWTRSSFPFGSVRRPSFKGLISALIGELALLVPRDVVWILAVPHMTGHCPIFKRPVLSKPDAGAADIKQRHLGRKQPR